METKKFSEPTVLVIFGSTGDLAKRKLLPALYHLLKGGYLPDDMHIVCVARDSNTTVSSILEKSQHYFAANLESVDKDILGKLKERMQVIIIDSTSHSDYYQLGSMLDAIDAEKGILHNRLYYMAIPPAIFKTVIECLGVAGLHNQDNGASRRILIEKPFGTDLASAKQLIDHINLYFKEDQVYRIDHYLAKETAQNILAFRYNNPLVEDVWGRQFIDHIQITSAETIDIEGRVNFYDNMGALRDFVQSHLLQLMAITMMEVPENITPDAIHSEKLALLESVQPIKESHVHELAVRGQYIGYKKDVDNEDSATETFAALRLEVANSRWGGVPVLVRTGKSLAEKVTEINLVFKDRSRRGVEPNVLTIRIQPNEGIGIRLQAKKPGFDHELQPVNMDFCYQTSFEDVQPDAYERVLVDAINGDQSLFATSAEVLQCWKILEPVLQVWKSGQVDLPEYTKGSWGPGAANELAKEYGCEWLTDTSRVCDVSVP